MHDFKKYFFFHFIIRPVILSVPAGASWVKLNVDQYGYYRVNYDDGLWDALIAQLLENHEVRSSTLRD